MRLEPARSARPDYDSFSIRSRFFELDTNRGLASIKPVTLRRHRPCMGTDGDSGHRYSTSRKVSRFTLSAIIAARTARVSGLKLDSCMLTARGIVSAGSSISGTVIITVSRTPKVAASGFTAKVFMTCPPCPAPSPRRPAPHAGLSTVFSHEGAIRQVREGKDGL